MYMYGAYDIQNDYPLTLKDPESSQKECDALWKTSYESKQKFAL